jgi:hypothetical protein
MIPAFVNGLLPPGIHWAEWEEVVVRFGTTRRRRWLLEGLQAALRELGQVGCTVAYLDGSFVTEKVRPGDYDLCWEIEGVDLSKIDAIFRDLKPPRAAQHAKYRGDLLPNVRERSRGMPFVDFFQRDKETDGFKGIIALDPRRVPR